MSMPASLREQMAADYAPVRALASPWRRALSILPMAMLALVAAPLAFDIREDALRLGWGWLWGASVVQAALGLIVVAAALRESIPGRGWSARSVALWLVAPLAIVGIVTFMSWDPAGPRPRNLFGVIALVCATGSAAAALPIVALATILAVRAYPTRPVLVGALAGLGAGLIADAGWRTFCHFSHPGHVLTAHLAGALLPAVIGALLAVYLTRTR